MLVTPLFIHTLLNLLCFQSAKLRIASEYFDRLITTTLEFSKKEEQKSMLKLYLSMFSIQKLDNLLYTYFHQYVVVVIILTFIWTAFSHRQIILQCSQTSNRPLQ
jgi:hypothetical protein